MSFLSLESCRGGIPDKPVSIASSRTYRYAMMNRCNDDYLGEYLLRNNVWNEAGRIFSNHLEILRACEAQFLMQPLGHCRSDLSLNQRHSACFSELEGQVTP